MKKNKKKYGFTLVELLISISIIAILSVVLSVSFSRAQKSGRDQRRIEDLKAIQTAAEQYYLLSGSYLDSSSKYAGSVSWKVGSQTVLQSFPIDPKNSGTYIYVPSNITAMSYCVCAKMENPKTGNSDSGCTFANTGYFCIKNQQ